MNTRLTINLRDGLLEVEGSEDFCRAVYQDFKEEVAKTAAASVPIKPVEQLEQQPLAPPKVDSVRKIKPRRGGTSDGGKTKASEYKPTFKNIDLSGLEEFYLQFSPKNHGEKILCFAIFLRDNLNISPCSADEIFTCYFAMKLHTRTPEAFQQAFIDTRNRTHFIEVDFPGKIEVTIAGNNAFHDNKRRPELR